MADTALIVTRQLARHAARQAELQRVDADVAAQLDDVVDDLETVGVDVAAQLTKLDDVVTALQAITDRTNADINTNPARAIKDVANEVKTIARQAKRIAQILARLPVDPEAIPETVP